MSHPDSPVSHPTSERPEPVTRRPRSALTDTAELRIPTQERGARRVQSILDAAAAIIIESGVEGVTAQALADRSGTSKGSLYHFFPDVHSVLRALGERHLAEISAIVSDIVSDPSRDWRTMPPQEVTKYLLTPLDYLEANCDMFALTRSPGVLPRSARSMQPVLQLVEGILGARFPEMDEERRLSRAATIVAFLDGVVGSVSRGCIHSGLVMRRELEELLTIYLKGIE